MIAPPASVTFRLRSRPAFTLLELMVAMAIVSIIMVAIGSTVLIAASAVPNGDSAAEETIEISRVVNGIADELRTAVHITDRSANAVTFTLADRTGDALPEVLRYEWSGTSGDPLTRQFNLGTAITVLENVQQFDLTYETRQVAEQYPGPPIEGAEIEMASDPSASDSTDFSIDDNDWIGQYFKPTLPADAASWSVTRVLFRAKYGDGTTGETLVQLRPADVSSLPTDTILEQYSMYESALPSSYAWQEFSFSNVNGIPPSQGLCLVLQWVSDNYSAKIEYDNAGGSDRLKTSDGGSSWTRSNSRSMVHYVYGKVTTGPGPNQTITRDHIGDVRVTLLAGDSSSLLETSAQTLNTPEVLTSVWEADFSADPTLIDLNGDAVTDWIANGGLPFEVVQLDTGLYWADGDLDTNPANDFTQPTTVELRLRDFADDGGSGGVKLHVDRTGDTYAFIKAEVKLFGGQQNLAVSYTHPTFGVVVLVSETASPGEFFDLRLLVDPTQDTVNINIDDKDRGTFQYTRMTKGGTAHAITLYETAVISGVQFDWVRVRVGGTGS